MVSVVSWSSGRLPLSCSKRPVSVLLPSSTLPQVMKRSCGGDSKLARAPCFRGVWVAIKGRAQRQVLERHGTRWKLHPLVDWTDRDVGCYLAEHPLPYHPLWEQGYVSIGDVHTTRPLSANVSARETRFFGLKRECGLHEAV